MWSCSYKTKLQSPSQKSNSYDTCFIFVGVVGRAIFIYVHVDVMSAEARVCFQPCHICEAEEAQSAIKGVSNVREARMCY